MRAHTELHGPALIHKSIGFAGDNLMDGGTLVHGTKPPMSTDTELSFDLRS